MKYCLSSRQTNEYLSKVEEIKVKYADRDIIYDFSQKYPNATIVLQFPFDKNITIDWDEIVKFNTVCQNNFIACLTDIRDALNCRKNNIKFYFGFAVGTFYELQALKKAGVCYLRLAAPAFFKMNQVKALGIPVRAVPNIAHEGYYPRENGIFGQWIRPEDLIIYENYIDTIEFEDADLQKERALYRIYHDDKHWPGEINMIITNFNHPGLNRLLPDGLLAERRLVCGQRCQEGGACRLCERYVGLAQEEIMRKLAEKAKAQKEE